MTRVTHSRIVFWDSPALSAAAPILPPTNQIPPSPDEPRPSLANERIRLVPERNDGLLKNLPPPRLGWRAFPPDPSPSIPTVALATVVGVRRLAFPTSNLRCRLRCPQQRREQGRYSPPSRQYRRSAAEVWTPKPPTPTDGLLGRELRAQGYNMTLVAASTLAATSQWPPPTSSTG